MKTILHVVVEIYGNAPQFDKLLFVSQIDIQKTEENHLLINFDRDAFIESFKETVSEGEIISFEYWANGRFYKFHDVDFVCKLVDCPFRPYPNIVCVDCWAEHLADNII
jgi:hypothetical protein